MRVEIARHALDRVPRSIIFDDSTVLVNLNYFFLRDHNIADGEHRARTGFDASGFTLWEVLAGSRYYLGGV